ncbi:MAG: ATP-binding protein [Thermodesulfobacteriota bacterium]
MAGKTDEKGLRKVDRSALPKFASQKGRGWIDVAGTRMCLFDIPGGWLSISRSMTLFAGEDTSKRVLFEAGLGETFSTTALAAGILSMTAEGFRDAVDTYSEAGFGDFSVRELRFSDGYARISCGDAFEAWALLCSGKIADSTVCYYSTGVLLSFMKHISGRSDLVATETKCMARGDDECHFVIGTADRLRQQGIMLHEWGVTIKEKAEFLENLLEEKKRVESELRRKNVELASLNKISATVSQSLDLNEISNLAVRELRKIVGDKAVVIYLIDPRGEELTAAAEEGFSREFLESVKRLSFGEGLTGNVARARSPMAYDDYAQYPQAMEVAVQREKIKSLLSVPLMSKNSIVGVLNIASRTSYHFTDEEIGLMSHIGNQLGVAIENARLHEEITESERKYKTLVEDINDGYFVCQGGQVVFANNAFLSMHGYSRDEALGKDLTLFISPDSVASVQEAISDKISHKESSDHLEFLRKHKDGRDLPTELKIDVSEFDGKLAIIGMFRDISERKRLEQRVLQHERLASIGQLASTIAHEIRNPLSAIKINIQILSKTLSLQGFDKERLEIAETEIKRLDRFVQDLLHFARPVKMRTALNSVWDILEECLALLADRLSEKKIKVIRHKPQHLQPIRVDFEKMEEVFLNILLNSLDAMQRGGEIDVSAGEDQNLNGPMTWVEIRDNGIGIPAAHVPMIFEPFFSTKTEGVGLGLSNVKKIVEAHCGSVEVDSRVNGGTSFKILLPAR